MSKVLYSQFLKGDFEKCINECLFLSENEWRKKILFEQLGEERRFHRWSLQISYTNVGSFSLLLFYFIIFLHLFVQITCFTVFFKFLEFRKLFLLSKSSTCCLGVWEFFLYAGCLLVVRVEKCYLRVDWVKCLWFNWFFWMDLNVVDLYKFLIASMFVDWLMNDGSSGWIVKL